MLELKGVSVRYDRIAALTDVSITAPPGEITCLLGSNGAGKSTCLRAISGLVKLASGEIWLDGRRIDGLAPHKIARLRVAHVPENKGLFPYLSVERNLLSGAFARTNKAAIGRDLESVYQRFPVLYEARRRAANSLSGGQQQMLALGRASMADPAVYLLDEPSLGLAPLVIAEVRKEIERLCSIGALILLVEQNAKLGLRLATRAYVLETGRTVLEGRADELAQERRVQEAYLGIG